MPSQLSCTSHPFGSRANMRAALLDKAVGRLDAAALIEPAPEHASLTRFVPRYQVPQWLNSARNSSGTVSAIAS